MDDVGVLILRMVIGIVMVPHGVYKFQHKTKLDQKWLEEYGFPGGSVVMTGFIQVVCGMALIVGVFNRLAALFLVLVMVVGTYASIWKNQEPFLSTPQGKGWDINFLLLGALFVLMILGDDRWSLLS